MTPFRIVAIAKHRFPFEMIFIILQFFLYVGYLRVEFIILRLIGSSQVCIQVFLDFHDERLWISDIKKAMK